MLQQTSLCETKFHFCSCKSFAVPCPLSPVSCKFIQKFWKSNFCHFLISFDPVSVIQYFIFFAICIIIHYICIFIQSDHFSKIIDPVAVKLSRLSEKQLILQYFRRLLVNFIPLCFSFLYWWLFLAILQGFVGFLKVMQAF